MFLSKRKQHNFRTKLNKFKKKLIKLDNMEGEFGYYQTKQIKVQTKIKN